MSKYEYFKSQRNKYFELYKTAQTEAAQEDCLRIMYWYSGELGVAFFHRVIRLENSLFLERLENFFLKSISEKQFRLIILLKEENQNLKTLNVNLLTGILRKTKS